MPSLSKREEAFIGTPKLLPPDNVLIGAVTSVADRCLDCGYWTLLEFLDDGYCPHCYVPEEDAW